VGKSCRVLAHFQDPLSRLSSPLATEATEGNHTLSPVLIKSPSPSSDRFLGHQILLSLLSTPRHCNQASTLSVTQHFRTLPQHQPSSQTCQRRGIMAESSKAPSDKTSSDASNNSQPSTSSGVTSEGIHAMFEAARVRASHIPSPTVYSSVSPAVAMAALMDIEEEGMREELVDPATTEEERAQIRERLAELQVSRETQRRWHEMIRTLEPPAPNSHRLSVPSTTAPSKTGKEPAR
jgi:hypothetical protein